MTVAMFKVIVKTPDLSLMSGLQSSLPMQDRRRSGTPLAVESGYSKSVRSIRSTPTVPQASLNIRTGFEFPLPPQRMHRQ